MNGASYTVENALTHLAAITSKDWAAIILESATHTPDPITRPLGNGLETTIKFIEGNPRKYSNFYIAVYPSST